MIQGSSFREDSGFTVWGEMWAMEASGEAGYQVKPACVGTLRLCEDII